MQYVGSTGDLKALIYIMKYTKTVRSAQFLLWKHFSSGICCHFKVSKPRKSIIRLMHIELQPDKRYYSIGEIAKAFDVNASLLGQWI
jgi:hypothetical protein